EARKPEIKTMPQKSREHPVVAANRRHPKAENNASVDPVKEALSERQLDIVAERMPLLNPFVDAETARHIERAQVLLRAFRNTRDDGKQTDPEILYEKQHSRDLLYKNILLR